MSSIELIGTPTLPTSPAPPRHRGRSPSGSAGRRRSTGRSGRASSRYLKRWLVSAAVAKPAYWRIVQSRPRYIVGWTPRVNGNSPGLPSWRVRVPARPGPRPCRARRSRCRWSSGSGAAVRRPSPVSLRRRPLSRGSAARPRARPGSPTSTRMSSDRAGLRRPDLVLHLHGLDRQQALAALDRLARGRPRAGRPDRESGRARQPARRVVLGSLLGDALAELGAGGRFDGRLEEPAVDDDLVAPRYRPPGPSADGAAAA